MKRRSIPKVMLLTVLTLGIYEIYWLYETRKELIALTGAQIPNIKRLIAIKMLGWVCLLVFVFGFYLAVTPRPSAPKPSPECLSQYSLSVTCRESIDKYYATDHQMDGIKLMFAMLVALFLGVWLNGKWLLPYFRAAGQVTGDDQLTKDTTTAIYLMSYFFGMAVLQARFNQLPKT